MERVIEDILKDLVIAVESKHFGVDLKVGDHVCIQRHGL